MESQVTLEIEATIPDGAPEQVVRTVTENWLGRNAHVSTLKARGVSVKW